MELGAYNDILSDVNRVQMYGMTDQDYRCAYLEMTSATTIKFLILSPLYAYYSDTDLVNGSSSISGVLLVSGATSGAIYETIYERAFYGAYLYDFHFYWLGNPGTLDTLSYSKTVGSIMSTNVDFYCYSATELTPETYTITSHPGLTFISALSDIEVTAEISTREAFTIFGNGAGVLINEPNISENCSTKVESNVEIN